MGSQEAAPWHRHRAACPVLGTATTQPKERLQSQEQPGRNSWRSLFSLQKERLNKKLGKGGNKASLCPTLPGERDGVQLQQRSGI